MYYIRLEAQKLFESLSSQTDNQILQDPRLMLKQGDGPSVAVYQKSPSSK